MVRTMIEMSPVNGIEIGRKLLRADPDVYLVYLAAHPEYEFESYKLEVDQYILKEEFWHLWECVSESGKKICCTARRYNLFMSEEYVDSKIYDEGLREKDL